MSFTHKITRAIDDGAASNSFTESVTSGEAIALDQSVATAQTDKLLAFAFTKTKLKSIVMWTDGTMRVCTNAAHDGSFGETVNMVSGRPVEWSTGDPLIVNPFAGDVTALYVTNTSGAAVVLHIRVIVDPT